MASGGANNERKSRKLTKEEITAWVEKRYRKLFTVLGAALVLLVVMYQAGTHFRESSKINVFHEVCRSVVVGADVGAIRSLASDGGIIFEQDFDTRRKADEEIFVVRPDENWPPRYGCRFRALESRVLSVDLYR